MKKHYGHRLRILHHCMDQAMTNALADMDLTAAQGRIMGYIAHRQEAPCAKDIEEEFRLSHPTVSGLLSRLEKKGFLEFRPDEKDHRCKRIYILPKGQQCNDLMHQTIRRNEERLVKDFTEEEQELFFSFLDRAIQNMGVPLCCKKPKEEPNKHD